MRSAFRGSRNSALICLLAAVAAVVTLTSHGATVEIDLDDDPSNGAESTVTTKVLQNFPVKIENVVVNNTFGISFTFDWAGAGPGGFSSILTPGPDVGTKWAWTTVSQVYSISTPASFVEDPRGIPVFGAPPGGFVSPGGNARQFTLPGKSIFPNQVTASTASLTSSLITFFSPENTLATCASSFTPGVFTQTITNTSGEDLVLTVEQEDCCLEPHQIICGDDCRSYLTDDTNCGDCGVTCAEDEFCDGGACAAICPGEGAELCDGECADTLNDDTNCGACGVTCVYDEFCDGGACAPICPGVGQELCDGECADTLNDDTNCGACGITCVYDEFCNGGTCAPICPGVGQEYCDGECADTLNDDANCGDCGVTCVYDEFCDGGTCAPICPGVGQELCDGECADTLNDNANCGACGITCAYDEFCDAGACAAICPGMGQEYCDGECADTLNDDTNCGACGVTCAYDEFCDTGACAPICPGVGQELCDGECADTLNDGTNCGACGITCAYDEFCDTGACAAICPGVGQELCDGECADTLNDTLNCGACGVTCAYDELCDAGACAPICPGVGQEYCDDSCVDTLQDPTNCGACGTACAGDEYCDGGSCEPVCAAGLTLCGMICVDLQNDPLHCGSCGNSCGSNDICGAATCTTCRPPQQTACDNVCVNIHTDPDNCGGCGNVCDFSDCPSGGVGTCSQGMSCICDGTDEADGSVSAPSYFPPVSTEQPESAVRLSVPKIDNSSTPPRPVVKPRPLPTKPRPLPVKVNVERADRMRNAEQSSAMANSVPTRPRPLPVKVSVERADRNRSVEQSSARPRSLPRRSGLGKAEPQAARRGKRRSTAVEQQKPNSSQLQRTSNASPTVEEAPVCEFQEPIEEIIIPDGETYIQCQTGTVLGAEVFTRASVVRDGQLVGVGPCAVFVPVPDVVVDDFYATTTAVILQDASGDGLLQPGEQADLYISLLNVGPLELMNPVVTLSGPPDQFNPTEVTVIADTAFFPDFPPFESVADCETPPLLEPQMALTPFTIVLPEEHEPDVGRALHLTITGDNVGPVTFELPLIIGIGEKCDPTNLDGEIYDGLDGFLSPLNVDLVPRGTAVNYSDSAFGRGSLIPLRLKLKCGALTLQPDEIDPKPRIISIVHDTLGPLPLALINVDFGPFPISPFFHCGELQCEFNMNSRNLPAGTYVVGVEMADSRVFEAGFTLSDIELPGDG